MRVRLLYFASFRDAAGRPEELRHLPDGATVGDLWGTLQREQAHFAAFRRMPPAAVNRRREPADRMLREGDEVAFLPPVSGG